jgi:hypothetical protein
MTYLTAPESIPFQNYVPAATVPKIGEAQTEADLGWVRPYVDLTAAHCRSVCRHTVMFARHNASIGERSSPHANIDENFMMPKLNEPRRSASSRREPAAAIPTFRKLGISALAAACAWERKPLQEPRERAAMQDGEERATADRSGRG